ncbi:MAG TPA: JAB domain-containing protein [Sphingomicrobium sp.]|nr:JAB domain-containing protein [Sphingomicrobium sp.]
MRHQRVETPITFNGLAAARQFFSGCFAEEDPGLESLWVAHLDGEARCLHLSRHQGDSCGADFPLREIIIDAAEHGTAAILVAHNHPSGDPRPSHSDLRATRRLATAAEALDCRLLDHLVFAGEKCTSLRRLGYL